VTDVVDRLVRHAAGHRAVTEHGDDVAVVVDTQVAGDRHPVGVREDRRGVAVLDEVVLRFLAAGIARQAALLTELLELALAAGDDLVDVRLVAGVPQDGVGRGVEHAVQGEGELDRAEVGAQVAARVRHRRHDEVADLAGEVVQLLVGEVPQVSGAADAFEIHAALTLSALLGRCVMDRPPVRRTVGP
jgi:hypothetical protein